MRYYTKAHTEQSSNEITKEQAKHYLEGAYKAQAVADIMDNEKQFRLRTPFRDIWTKSENGMIPMPGFYGVCE